MHIKKLFLPQLRIFHDTLMYTKTKPTNTSYIKISKIFHSSHQKNRSDPSDFLTKSEMLFQLRPRIRMKQTNKYKNIARDSRDPQLYPPAFAVAQQPNIRTRPLLFPRGPVRDFELDPPLIYSTKRRGDLPNDAQIYIYI